MKDQADVALVTGAAGFIWSHLLVGPLERRYDVIGVDICGSESVEAIEPLQNYNEFRFVDGDVRDAPLMAELLDRADRVFHQAAFTSVGLSYEGPVETAEVNCTGTNVLLSEVKNSALYSIVVALSASVYGSGAEQLVSEDAPLDPESPYAASMCWSERLALQLEDHLEGTIVALRYFNVYGPGQDPSGTYAAVVPSFISRVREGRPPIVYGDGEQTRTSCTYETWFKRTSLPLRAT